MMACTDIFWHSFYQAAGIPLGLLLPRLLGFDAVILILFRLQHCHEAAMHEARRRAESVREARVRVLPGGQG